MDIKKKRKYRLFVIIIFAICILAYIIFNAYRSFKENSRNPIYTLSYIPDDYVKLFNNSAKEKLHILITTGFKLRNPISDINYGDNLDLEVTKINCKPSFNIKKDIIESHEDPSATTFESYLTSNISNITTNYNPESNKTASKIYLSMVGDSITTIVKNDSVACYYLKPKNVTVQYSPNGIKEMFIEKKYFYTSDEPIEIMFLKRNNQLYYLFLASKNEDYRLSPNLLLSFIR